MERRRFEELVDEAMAGLPAWVRERLDNVAVIVEEEPPEDDPDLLGLYEGIPLTDRGADYFGVLPDRIRLFRRVIEEEAGDEKDVTRVVQETVIHEVAHFFGISDERLHDLDRD
ncbi:MAG TPA: metallopeptidase family protein [Actinomycetota bacterium]|nr:metallopeptidase family protein [Actinomycetota bacterium]